MNDNFHSTNKLIKFINCQILRDHRIIKDDFWVRNGKIVDPQQIFYKERNQADEVIDCHGSLISPGLIDLQVNGGLGVDFSHNLKDVESGVEKVAHYLLTTGVTSFCPTLVSSSSNVYVELLPKLKPREGGKWGASILGAHVEGPFINELKKGAHEEACILQFDEGVKTVKNVYKYLNFIKIITLAPELEHALDVIKFLNNKGIVVSLGHSMSDYQTGEKAVCAGATLITHLFNAMLPFHHRDPGLVGLLTAKSVPCDKTVFFGIISDGHHTHPAALRIAYRTHYPGLILVTDCTSALGFESGVHHIGGKAIEVKNGAAYIQGTNVLSGSILPLIKCVKFFKYATDCSLVEALEAATLHPAQVLGIEMQKGTLNFGADADFFIMDKNFDILSTWIAGNCVYSVTQ